MSRKEHGKQREGGREEQGRGAPRDVWQFSQPRTYGHTYSLHHWRYVTCSGTSRALTEVRGLQLGMPSRIISSLLNDQTEQFRGDGRFLLLVTS